MFLAMAEVIDTLEIAHLDLDGLTLFLGCKPAAEHRLTVEQVEHAAEVAEKVFPTRDLVR